jgi:uncharacterized RmlC-like cupin family protein
MPVKVLSLKRRSNDIAAKEMVTYFGLDSTNSDAKSIAIKFDVIPPKVKTDDEFVAHPSESLIFMIRGKLKFHEKSKDGSDSSFDIKAGDFIHVPAGIAHYAENLGSEAAEAIVTIPVPKFTN